MLISSEKLWTSVWMLSSIAVSSPGTSVMPSFSLAWRLRSMMICCWRAARTMSVSVCRKRANASAWLPLRIW